MSGGNTTALPSKSQAPRPYYFISRKNGLLVPLIPADELPISVRLQGVSRILQSNETYGMQHVGTLPFAGSPYKLEEGWKPAKLSVNHASASSSDRSPSHHSNQSNTFSSNPHFLAPDTVARRYLAQQLPVTGPAPNQRPLSAHEVANPWRFSATASRLQSDHTKDAIQSIGAKEAACCDTTAGSSIHPPSGIVPDQEKKEYCTYWIKRGECDYTQQGCLYKHEMPDKATLAKIGINNVPRWWAEKNCPLKLRCGQKGGGSSGEDEKITGTPVAKGNHWLKELMQEDEGSDSGDDADSSASDDLARNSHDVGIGKCMLTTDSTSPIRAQPKKIETVATGDDSATLERFSNLAAYEVRKASTSSDLIDFTPLVPAPSSVPTSKPSGAVQSPPKDVVRADSTKPKVYSTGASNVAKSRVFVPKGESPETHIPDKIKRTQVNVPKTRRRNAVVSATFREQTQNQTVRLMANKHAPPSPAVKLAPEHTSNSSSKGVASGLSRRQAKGGAGVSDGRKKQDADKKK